MLGPEPLAGIEHHLLDAVDRQVVVRGQLAPAPFVESRDIGELAQREDQRTGIDGEGLDRREERFGLRRLEPELVGIADPGPVEDRANEENELMPRFQLSQPRRHPGDAPDHLVGRWRRDRRQYRRGVAFGANLLESVGVWKGLGHRDEPWRFQVDERARDPLSPRRPQGGDHTLTGVDRDIAEARLPLGLVIVGSRVDLNHYRDHGQSVNGRLHVLLERRRQRYRHAVIWPAQQLFAHLDRVIAGTVDDRQDPDPWADRQEVVGTHARGTHRSWSLRVASLP